MTPVSNECGCAIDLPPTAIRSHLGRAGLPSLAVCPWENRVQECRLDLQSPARTCARVPWPFHTCRRRTQSPVAALCWHQPPDSAFYQTVDCRQPSLSGCRPTDLEQLAGRRDISRLTLYFSSPSQDTPVPKILSGLYAGHKLTVSGGPSSSTAT